jgi:ABC-type sugar transport system ATPase subunit
MARVGLRHLQKSYGSRNVFDDFTLEVADGELLSLLGPSGSGKTTLLRLIAGLEVLQGGEIWIGDAEVSAWQPRDRHIGMTFQGYALYPHMSVRQNLRYPLDVRRVPRQQADRRVTDAAQMLNIAHLLDRRVQQISGGEQQRVAIGRAIVQQPQLYLLDEPISNLDASLRETVRGEIRRLQQKLRATMVIVTHDQMDALAIADRIAVLRDGRLQQIGTPAELYQQPANQFVAGFLGRLRMNFLAGTIASENRPVLQGDGFVLRLPDRLANRLPAQVSDVTLGFRPDAVDILSAPSDDAWVGTIQIAQFQGDQLIATVDVGTPIQVTLPAPASLTSGQRIWLRPKPYAAYLFDRRTGERLDATTFIRATQGVQV